MSAFSSRSISKKTLLWSCTSLCLAFPVSLVPSLNHSTDMGSEPDILHASFTGEPRISSMSVRGLMKAGGIICSMYKTKSD